MFDEKDKLLRKSLEHINYLLKLIEEFVAVYENDMPPNYYIVRLEKSKICRDDLEEYFKKGSDEKASTT